LRDYVTTTYVPAARDTVGISQAPGGAAMYAFLVRHMTTTNYTPEQIHEIGLKEVARIQFAMLKIRRQLNFTGTAEEFSDQVLNAPRFRFHSEEEILVHGRDIAKRIDPELPRLFKVLPRMTYGVAAIPPDRARTSSEYYEQPALDGSRAGYFYMRTIDPEKQSSCCSESTILHESVPGHHLQIALSYETPGVPNFRKISEFTAYTEGWALYAETLGSALHMYETPYEKYGQLQGELFRAARLVVDTGIHTQGWTREKAIDYMYGSGADPSRDFMASEVDRYIAWPGQALAYKIGQLKILELRTLAEKELGPKFDIRAFHDVVLRNGTLPLDILEEQVREWISQSHKSASSGVS
jgi:prolyl oligopeptidase